MKNKSVDVDYFIKVLDVRDCYAAKDLKIEIGEEKKHLILTGKNGSGKTTILNGIDRVLQKLFSGLSNERKLLNSLSGKSVNHAFSDRAARLRESADVLFNFPDFDELERIKHNFILSCFPIFRSSNLMDVKTVENIDLPATYSISHDKLLKLIKQYLVNKQVWHAFDVIEGKAELGVYGNKFMDGLESILRTILGDPQLKIRFARKKFEYYLDLSDGRSITFNQLPSGFSALLSIILDLLVRTDLVRERFGSYDYDPNGIVLIDELEAHLHLEMQYLAFPLLTSLFPNIQFIIATHSPAVISSERNVVVYDLTNCERVENLIGKQFSELMITHFGLKSEFSVVAKTFNDEVKALLNEQLPFDDKKQKINALMANNRDILSRSLSLEIESLLLVKEAETIND